MPTFAICSPRTPVQEIGGGGQTLTPCEAAVGAQSVSVLQHLYGPWFVQRLELISGCFQEKRLLFPEEMLT